MSDEYRLSIDDARAYVPSGEYQDNGARNSSGDREEWGRRGDWSWRPYRKDNLNGREAVAAPTPAGPYPPATAEKEET